MENFVVPKQESLQIYQKEQMSVKEKLKILSDAAKYDVSCSSSGVGRKGDGTGIGNTESAGICHSFSSDGRCISLLKILFTNECIYDCKYCINRRSNDVPRTSFTPDEICELTIEFYRRNYIEGLFLSSGIIQSPTYTMELIYEAILKLRTVYRFQGYIHVKAIPGADPMLIERLGMLASARNRVKELKEDAFLGKSTIVFGEIQGGVHPYQVPAECKVSVDMRVVPPYHIEDVKTLLEAAAEDAAKEIPGLKAEIRITGNRPPIAHHEDAEMLSRIRTAVEQETGKVPVVSAFPGYTDTAVIAGTTGNCNCLSYGPGTLAMAHKADEYVDEADIRRCQKVYETLLKEWLWM